jgi:hypothetical protein
MDQMDIVFLQDILREYGVKGSVTMLIRALRSEADALSDLGLKEKSVQAANMADILGDLNGE